MPDLNSVPPSPHSLAVSRRRSSHSTMPPPPVPQSPSLHVLPSNQGVAGHAWSHSRSRSQSQNHGHGHGPSSSSASSFAPLNQSSGSQLAFPPALDSGVGPGPGPLRHPRPLTATELHMQLEKEQEAVVNRLTRELSLLRAAQNASVVSNASSTSATASTHEPPTDSFLLHGPSFGVPTARRHQRNSSSTSHAPSTQLASSYEARPRPTLPLSRQDSAASRSQTNSPGPQTSSIDPSSYFHQQRVPPPASVPMSSVGATPGSGSLAEQMSPSLMPATSRYEETAFYRLELEAAKKENEGLKRRIRDLERMVQSRRASAAGRVPSDAASTTTATITTPMSVSHDGPPRRPERGRGITSQSTTSITSLGVGVPEDEVKVGESAASSGLGNNRQ